MARQSGRKSAAAHSIAPLVDARKQRIRPRAEDPADVQAIVAERVAAADADHFAEVDWPILTSYAQAILMERRAYAHLAVEGEVLGLKTNPWVVIAEKAGRQIIAASMRLRLAPQSIRERPTSEAGRAQFEAALRAVVEAGGPAEARRPRLVTDGGERV